MWRPDWPCAVAATLSILRAGRGDPTFRVRRRHHLARHPHPEGPPTLRLVPRPAAGEVHGEAWGSGADWALDSCPAMLGADDDPAGFEPVHRRSPTRAATATGGSARPTW